MRPRSRRLVPALVAATVAATLAPASLPAQPLDTARALGALRDADAACRADAGALWGRPLCGPIALVDRGTRLVLASDTVAGRPFVALGDAYVTTLPGAQFVANTSFTWGGRPWAMVALPLPADRFARAVLVLHESFHREQPALGLAQTDALNTQLDTRDGRTWLRLEYRALAAALDALGEAGGEASARRHAEAALLFRARRRALHAGSDSLEATLEIQEGLPEYTAQRLAMALTGEGPARAARAVRDVDANTPTFVRAFAYGTGPALGLLLDRFAPRWQATLRALPAGRRDLGATLAAALAFRAPSGPRALAGAARARAARYDWDAVDRAEAAREAARAPLLGAYRARLAEGPTLTFRQTRDSLRWSFDPTALVGLDLRTAVYPTGTFTAPWGTLAVEAGGVLVANDLATLRVGAPAAPVDTAARRIVGTGWTATLVPGWAVHPDPARPGSYVVRAATPGGS